MPAKDLLSSLEARPAEIYPWGWIRWLISADVHFDATMTLGVCQIEPGRSNPLHFHPNCEELLLVQSGRCRKRIGDETMEMGPGDCIRIPEGARHQATCISKEPLLCVIAYDTPRREVVFLE